MSAIVEPGDVNVQHQEKTSVLLGRIMAELPAGKVQVDWIVMMLRRRSFGGLFIALSALSLIPGISFFAGLAMLLPAIQMMLGLSAPRLPVFIREYELPVAMLKQRGAAILPWIERIERYIKPRWTIFTVVPSPNLMGLVIVFLAMVIMIPLPFSNLPPALATFLLALGLLEKDGVMIVIGALMSILALGIGVLVTSLAFQSLGLILANGI